MDPKNKIIEALRKFPLVFYVLSFIVISVSLIISGGKPEADDLDKFVYRKTDENCAPIIVLTNYDYGKVYRDSLKWLEKADSVSIPFLAISPNSKVKVQYERDGLIKISFLKDNEIADGFVVKEYLHEDSCFKGMAVSTKH